MNEQNDSSTTAAQPDKQSHLTDDELLCGECNRRTDAVRLERTGEETIDETTIQDFECPGCGATGNVIKRGQGDTSVSVHGCVTTPRLIDLERARVWEEANGGRY